MNTEKKIGREGMAIGFAIVSFLCGLASIYTLQEKKR